MWIQYNDHFEPFYLIASKATFGSLPAEDQKIIADVAQEMTLASMDAMQERDRRYHEALRDAGIEVEILSKEELEAFARSEEHKSELQSLMRISYAVSCLKKKTNNINKVNTNQLNNTSTTQKK